MSASLLVSCSQENIQTENTDSSVNTSETNTNVTTENTNLNENITTTTSDSTWVVSKTFTLKNSDWKILNGILVVENWTVKDMTFVEDISSWEWSRYKFVNKVKKIVIWKEISAINIPSDVVSWASWVAYEFDTFLKTLK